MACFKYLIILSIVLLNYKISAIERELDQLSVLIDYLQSGQSEARVGFLSKSNYLSVKRILPNKTTPVIVELEDDIVQMVLNGSLVAGLVTGSPDFKYHDQLYMFSSNLVALQSILMAPDLSTESPHGVGPALSTLHLSQAINAAVARVQFNGIDLGLAKKAPKDLIQAHTCKEDQLSQFPLPNRSQANGLLKDVLDKQIIKVLAIGPYDWGSDDGNYFLNPPVGFFPDLLQAIIDQFQNLSGPDNVTFGRIEIQRIFTKQDPFPWCKLFDGTAHITEPYFILDATYTGSGKNCSSDSDCFSAFLPGGFEKCVASVCTHPARPRNLMLRSSCTTLGSDSKFFTKKGFSNIPKETSLNGAAIAFLVILSVTAFALIGFVVFLAIKERRGEPLFTQFN